MSSKIDRAVTALREAADALAHVPRRTSVLGMPFVDPAVLRAEAAWLESWAITFAEAVKDDGA